MLSPLMSMCSGRSKSVWMVAMWGVICDASDIFNNGRQNKIRQLP